MRSVIGVIIVGALGVATSVYTPETKAGVVIGVGLPGSVVVSPAPYYRYYAPAPYLRVGFGPAFFGPRFLGPGFHGPVCFHPGYTHGAFVHGGYPHGGHFHGR